MPFPFALCVNGPVAERYRDALAELPPAHPLHLPLQRSYAEPIDLLERVPPALLGMAAAPEAIAA